MSDATNAEIEIRLKQLEDRLRLTRVDVDRLQTEITELRKLLSARDTHSAAATTAAPAGKPTPVAESAVSARTGGTAQKGANQVSQPGQSAKQQTQQTEQLRPTPRKPAGPSLLTKLTDLIKSRVGGIAIEEFVGLNLLNKIGILMLVVGGGFFLRIAYQWVGPEIKLAGLTLLASGALLGGEYFFRKASGNFRLFGLGLAAGGSVLLFFNAFAAYHVDATRVIPQDQAGFAYLLLLIVAGGIVANSLRYNSETFTGFAYLLAFISISINESEASAECFTGHFALVALAILAASLIFVMSLRRWKFLGVLGLLGTYANFFWYATALPRTLEGFVWRGEALTDLENFAAGGAQAGPDYFFFAFLYLLIYWLVFSVSIFTMPVLDAASRRIGVWLNIANVLCFYLLVAYIRPPATEWGSFAITSGLGLACLGIAVLGRLFGREHLWSSSVLLGAGLLALAVPFRFSEYGLVFGWLIQATVLIALGYRLREPLFRYAGYLVLFANVGAFLDLPPGDLIYGFGPEALSGPEGLEDSQGANFVPPLWTFDWNRGLLYCFMIVCFFGLQIFAALVSRVREQGNIKTTDVESGGAVVRTPVDHIAWHVLGAFGTLVVFLLSHYSLLLSQQALFLIPFALLLLLPHRFLRIGPFLLYAVILLWAALLSASGLIIANEAPGLPVYQRLSLILLAIGGGLVFVYYRHFSPDAGPPDNANETTALGDARTGGWRFPSPVPARILAGLALWLPAIVLPAFAGHHIDARITILGAALAVGLLGMTYLRYRQGLMALFALCSFSVLFVTVLYIVQLFEAADFQIRFLWNSGWLWLVALIGAATVHIRFARENAALQTRRSGFAFAGTLTVAALVALAWIQIQVAPPFQPAAILGYAVVLVACLWWRDEFSGRALTVALAMLAFLVGPLYWIFFDGLPAALESVESDSGGINARNILAISALPALSAFATILLHPVRRARDLNALVSLGFLLAAVHILVPSVYRPSCYGLITLGNYYLLGRLRLMPSVAPDEWSSLVRAAPAPFVFTILSFAALLLNYSDTGAADVTGFPLVLRAIMGVAPLLFLAFSLGLHGALFGNEELTPFQRAGYPALLLAFVLLTMSLIGIGWWSLAWAVLGVIALVVGILRNMKLLRYGGFALILLALLKLALWDIRELESTARVIVLVCIGMSFVVASYFYARFKDLIFPKE